MPPATEKGGRDDAAPTFRVDGARSTARVHCGRLQRLGSVLSTHAQDATPGWPLRAHSPPVGGPARVQIRCRRRLALLPAHTAVHQPDGHHQLRRRGRCGPIAEGRGIRLPRPSNHSPHLARKPTQAGDCGVWTQPPASASASHHIAYKRKWRSPPRILRDLCRRPATVLTGTPRRRATSRHVIPWK